MQQNTTGATMTMDMEKMAQDYLAAWNSHDVEKIVSFFTDDCVYEDFGNQKTCHGKTELRDWCNSIFADYPDFKIENKTWFSSGNRAAYDYTLSGTHSHSSNPAIPATGKKFSIPGVSLLELSGGKIKHKATYYNAAAFLQQVGLMPDMTAR